MELKHELGLFLHLKLGRNKMVKLFFTHTFQQQKIKGMSTLKRLPVQLSIFGLQPSNHSTEQATREGGCEDHNRHMFLPQNFSLLNTHSKQT